MSITELSIQGLRNLASTKFLLHPQLNVVYGPNGSGKTSFLEALYLLSSAHSFRTRETAPLITHGETMMCVFARTDKGDAISVQKERLGGTLVRVNQQPCYRSSDLARLLPCQVFHHDLFQILEAGPSIRRGLLDWGMFHVEHSYLNIWKEYRMVLKQRNALLRQNAPKSQFTPWDSQLVALALMLDNYRLAYFEVWKLRFLEILPELSDHLLCTLTYYRGWGKRQSDAHDLALLLEEQWEQDLRRQYTHSGAHQADIIITHQDSKAKQHFSRGQQKMLLMALKLAQSTLLASPCLFLFDDVHAELDEEHIQRFLQYLSKMKGQCVITALEETPITKGLKSDALALFKLTA